MSEPTPYAELAFLQCLLENIPDRIFFKDLAGHFIGVSRSEAEYLNVPDSGDLAGKSDFDFFDQELAQTAFADEQRIIQTGQPIIGQVERKRLLDGRTGWALVAKIPLKDATGEIIGTCGISKDITKLKETEEALEEANAELALQKRQLEQTLAELTAAQAKLIEVERSEWVARLAFSVAHEIRNPLNILGVGMDYLAADPSIHAENSSEIALEQMATALKRADVVISALMRAAAGSNVKLNSAEIAATLESALKIMKKVD